MTDYSEAIQKGVYNWLDSNRDVVLDIVHAAVAAKMDGAINALAEGSMKAIGGFLDANADDLKTGIAMAIATSWAARQHPLPDRAPTGSPIKDP